MKNFVLKFMVILTFTLLLPQFSPQSVSMAQTVDDDWVPVVVTEDNHPACLPDEMDNQSASEGTSSKPISGESDDSIGDVADENSEAHKVAKEIYDTFVNDYGTSGEFAIGVLANVKYESGFIPDRAEGAGIVRFGMDKKSTPSGSVNSANPGSTPGGGLYQFTPHTKYSDSSFWQKDGKKGWDVKNQTDFVVDSEFKGNLVMVYLRDAAVNPNRNPEGMKPYKDVVDWGMTDDMERATWAFQSGYERPQNFDLARIQTAKQLAKVFNPENDNGDRAKLEKTLLGGSSSASDDSDSSSSSSSNDDGNEELENNCTPSTSKVSQFDWLEDHTGEHGQQLHGGVKYIQARGSDSLSEAYSDIEQYFIQPDKLGMEWQKGGYENGWHVKIGNPAKNQCVDLTTALAGNLWWKDGKDTLKMLDNGPNPTGNGYDTASNLGATYAGKAGGLSVGDKGYSKKPTKGALFSVGGGQYGHTGIVSHVFENGDIAVTEMNVTNYSGEGNGTNHDWNYGIISASKLEQDGYTFFDPSAYGYEPNPEALK